MEIIHGSCGYRFICGDFNGDDHHFPEWEEWVRARWHEVQSLQFRCDGQLPVPTCKGRTRPDRLGVSPKLAARFRSCSVHDLFVDHSLVSTSFDYFLICLWMEPFILGGQCLVKFPGVLLTLRLRVLTRIAFRLSLLPGIQPNTCKPWVKSMKLV